MKKEYLVCLQILVLLLIVSNHFLALMYPVFIYLYWFGLDVGSIVLDIVLCLTLILQFYLIINEIRR